MNKGLEKLKFALWMYGHIFRMWPYYSKVNKLRAEGNIPGEIDAIRDLQHKWGIGVLERFGVKLHVRGLEHIPQGPVLFVSNHQSYADIPIFVAAIDRQIAFFAKAELSQLPIFGSWIKAVRSILIKRKDARAALKAVETGGELLKQGFSIGIFPEGTRSRGPNMLEFKRGSLKIATRYQVPIVTVVIKGSYKSYEENGYPQPADVDIVILQAVETEGLTKAEAHGLAAKIEELIRCELLS